jgi:hypothetical protein
MFEYHKWCQVIISMRIKVQSNANPSVLKVEESEANIQLWSGWSDPAGLTSCLALALRELFGVS